MRVRPAQHRDLPAVRSLLRAANLPDEDVASHLATLLVGECGGTIVAAGALEPLGTSVLLRSLAVTPACRGRGWGQRVAERLLGMAAELGMGDVYLLTINAADFFAGLDFERMPREGAPERVRRTRQFTELCPATAVLMRRRADIGARTDPLHRPGEAAST